jgi:steroid delta-isomerase-like uncharacterized protein
METTTTSRTTTSPGALARRLIERLGARDLDGVAELQHPDVVDDFIAVGVVRGKAEVRRFFEEMLAAFPDFRIEILQVTEQGSRAVVQWQVEATFTGGPFQGVRATGKRVRMRGVDCMEFEGGLLRNNVIYYDGAGFAREVGLLPAQGSGAEKAMTGAFNALTRARRALGR